MAKVLDKTEEDLEFMSDEDATAYFEQIVQSRLKITSEEFLARLDAGEYKNSKIPGITGLLALVPLVKSCQKK